MKTLKQTVLLSLLVAFAFSSCSLFAKKESAIVGDGNIVEKTFPIDEYTSISLIGKQDLYYEQKENKAPYVRIELDENLLHFVDVKVNKKELVFEDLVPIRPTAYRVYTNSRNLAKLKCGGSGEIWLSGTIKVKDLDIDLTGSSNFYTEDLRSKNIELNLHGSGTATLKGTATNADFRINGSGTIKAFGFSVDNQSAVISGSGNIFVNTAKSLDAKVSGSGDIEYIGSPKKVSHKITGIGHVRPSEVK